MDRAFQSVEKQHKATGEHTPHVVFVVDVTHGDKMWIATCDALHLVTEAESYDSLVLRVWEIAPELFELNQLKGAVEDMHLRFQHNETYTNRMVH